MQDCFLASAMMPNGYYKVVVQGHADGHIMDWRGSNYRFKTVRGQPKQGFLTEKEALVFLGAMIRAQRQEEIDRGEVSAGYAINERQALHARRALFDQLPLDMQDKWAE